MASNPHDGGRRGGGRRGGTTLQRLLSINYNKCAKLNGGKKYIYIYIYGWRLGLSLIGEQFPE